MPDSSASCKRSRPPSNLVNGQEFTMCDVWISPQSHSSLTENPISCGTHYSGPGLSENDSAVTTDVGQDQNWEVWLWGLPLKWNWPMTTIADCESSLHPLVTSIVCKSLHSGLHNSRRSGGGWKTSSYNGQSRWHSACIVNLSVAALHHRAGGSIFVRTGNHGNGVTNSVIINLQKVRLLLSY